MAMRGWIASNSSFSADLDPATMNQLKKFSTESGGGPFTFEIADVVDTHNNEGSLDHAVWIEVFNDAKEKLGELSIEVSDNEAPASSNRVLLAACLDKLGFVDEFEGMNEFNQENPPQDAEPLDQAYSENNLDPQEKVASYTIHASRLLTAIASTGIELDDPSDPESKGYQRQIYTGIDSSDLTAEDRRYLTRMERSRQQDPPAEEGRKGLLSLVNKLKAQLVVPTQRGNMSLNDYLARSNDNWTSIFNADDPKIKQIGYTLRSQISKFLQSLSPKDKSAYQAFFDENGSNLYDILSRKKLETPSRTASMRIADTIEELDSYMGDSCPWKAPFILEIAPPDNIPEASEEPSKLHVN